ncbi:MAG TPA: sigma-70 factor domain-containing protein [Candidatus Saccharimonadales bacterium]|nr:sigma-70 factor domain-containing protein [Candidatus Saccharimonadales bacterium]
MAEAIAHNGDGPQDISRVYKDPQFLDEAIALAGGAPFTDEHKNYQLKYAGVNTSDPRDLAAREPLYVQTLRILAEERLGDRRQAKALGHIGAASELGKTQRWNDAWVNALTEERLSQIALVPETRSVGRPALKPSVINVGTMLDALKLSDDIEAERSPLLRRHQYPYAYDLQEFADSEPQIARFVDSTGTQHELLVRAATVDGPTGMGKTPLAAYTLVHMGVGRLVTQEDGTAEAKMGIVVVPSNDLKGQYLGQTGNDTFRMFAQGTKVGGRNPSYPFNCDIKIINTWEYTKYVRDGKLDGRPIGVQVFDEAHHITEPLVLDTFIKHASSVPTIGFTATTAYNETKDVKKILPYVIKHADTLSYMFDGVLNKGQLFMVPISGLVLEQFEAEGRALSKQEKEEIIQRVAREVTFSLVMPWLEEGRRGIIYCKAGNKAGNAIDMAKYFDGVELSNGHIVRAEALHTFKKSDDISNQEARQLFREGELDLFTSIDYGREGLDEAIDFVAVAFDGIASVLKYRQMAGRGTRLSQEFPYTMYAQLAMPGFVRADSKSIFDSFGVPTVEQGQVIGERPPASGRISRIERDRQQKATDTTDNLPNRIKELLQSIQGKPVGEVYTTLDKRFVPPEFIRFDAIYAPTEGNISVVAAQKRLEKSGYAWVGVYEPDDNDKMVLARYYEPTAATFFTENPVPPKRRPEEFTEQETAHTLGISLKIVRTFRNRLEGTPLAAFPRIADSGKEARHFSAKAVTWMQAELEKAPLAGEQDWNAARIAREYDLDLSMVNQNIDDTDKEQSYLRRVEDIPGKRFSTRDCWDEPYARAIGTRLKARQELYTATPSATDDDWSLARIAHTAGVPHEKVESFLNEDDRASLQDMKTTGPGRIRILGHLTAERAALVVTRIEESLQNVLPGHLIPYAAVQERLERIVRDPPRWLDIEKITISTDTKPMRVTTWEGLRLCEEKFGRDPHVAPIDFSRLPQNAEDTDFDKLTYAYQVQSQHVPARYIKKPVAPPEAAPQHSENEQPASAPQQDIPEVTKKTLQGYLGTHYPLWAQVLANHFTPEDDLVVNAVAAKSIIRALQDVFGDSRLYASLDNDAKLALAQTAPLLFKADTPLSDFSDTQISLISSLLAGAPGRALGAPLEQIQKLIASAKPNKPVPAAMPAPALAPQPPKTTPAPTAKNEAIPAPGRAPKPQPQKPPAQKQTGTGERAAAPKTPTTTNPDADDQPSEADIADDTDDINVDESLNEIEKKLRNEEAGAETDIDLLRLYIRQIRQYKLLNAKQEVELAKAIEAGNAAEEQLRKQPPANKDERRTLERTALEGKQAKERLINANLRLAMAWAFKYKYVVNAAFTDLDRIQHANLGLIRAAEKFDYRKGYKFSTYAVWWLKQTLGRGVDNDYREIRQPVHSLEMASRIVKVQQQFAAELKQPPSDVELLEILTAKYPNADALTLPGIQATLKAMNYRVYPFSTPLGNDTDGIQLGDIIADKSDETQTNVRAVDLTSELVINSLSNEYLVTKLKELAEQHAELAKALPAIILHNGLPFDIAKIDPDFTDIDIEPDRKYIRSEIGQLVARAKGLPKPLTTHQIGYLERRGLAILKENVGDIIDF